MHDKENRRYSRAGIRWPVTMLGSQAKLKGQTENVSVDGAFICCEDAPPVDRNFFMIIETSDEKTMSIAAKVIWSTVLETKKSGSCFGLGVRFTNVSPSDRQFLSSVIEKHNGLKKSRSKEETE
jgi:Tfp pilus assembly protein PilZ